MSRAHRFFEVFQNHRTVLPVIHVMDQSQAIDNAGVAFEAGADGVWLISHTQLISNADLLRIHQEILKHFPNRWVGINFLSLTPYEAMQAISLDVSGVWADNAGIMEYQEAQPYATKTLEAKHPDWDGLYFGGVAFKYQRPVNDLETAARLAAPYMDVITTSGPATGRAPNVEHLRRLRAGAWDHPIAVASGVSPQNVKEFLPYVDAVMVSTGISYSFDHLDPILTRILVEEVRSWEP